MFPPKALTHLILIALMLSILVAAVSSLHAMDIDPAVKDKGPRGERTASPSKYINFDPAQSSTYFLYPVMFYINTAFDSAQCPAAFSQKDYFINHVKLFNRIKDPVRAINRDGGFGKLLMDEFLTERVLPNMTLHLIGGGYDFRTLAEWYDYYRVPVPYIFAFLTLYAAQWGNEAIEYNNKFLTSHDPIADLLFFDIVGCILFANDSVAHFFHDTMQLRNWLGQPVYSIQQQKILNANTSYVFRPYLFGKTVRPFLYMGMTYLLGLAVNVHERDNLSFGMGVAVTEAFDPEHDRKIDYLKKIRLSGGIFWDRNDALLISLLVNTTENYLVRLNVYPEFFNFDYVNFGFFIALDNWQHTVFGVSLYKVIGIGGTR